MTTIKTFPGVYTSIVDKSFTTPSTSTFMPGLVGVATRGPFDVPTSVVSLKDYVNKFGNPLMSTYTKDVNGIVTPDGSGYFLADAVDALADQTDAITVVRIGNHYTDLSPSDAYSYGTNTALLYSPSNAPRVQALLYQNNGNLWIKVAKTGVSPTVNAKVTSAGSGTIALDSTGVVLAAPYNAATISYSPAANASNPAQGVLYAYTYGSNSGIAYDQAFTAAGSVSGNKSDFQFYCSSNANSISVGDVLKIKQANLPTTHEARVNSVLINYTDTSGTVFLEKTDITQIGYQALPLQATYTNATIYKATGKTSFLTLLASTDGTWANGADSTEGLYLKVRPGSNAGTKKLEVYWNSALTETWDNISDDPADTVNFWSVILAPGNSAYVYVSQLATTVGAPNPTAANTVNPWDSRFYISTPVTGLPRPMPQGALNAGALALTVGSVSDTGGQFTNGFNGENPSDADWIGSLNTATDTYSGIQALEQSDLANVNWIAAPQDNISTAVMERLAQSAKNIKAVSVCDVPAGLTARQAIDWHNGALPSQSGYRVDNANLSCYWNWFTRTNRFGETKLVPPTLAVLECAAIVYNTAYPWSAIAGLTRGYVQDALSLQFNTVSEDVKQGMQGNGNSVNPILNIKKAFYIFGERTMQRAESKLTALHSVILVNWVVNNMANIAKKFVFDPNDAMLLSQLNLAFTDFLNRIVNERGLEQYSLVMDSTNNTADTRNARSVIVDLSLIPTDVAERIYLNCTVLESGAIINSVK